MEQSTIRKALTIASSGGYLIPEVVDGAIRDYAATQPVLYNVVNKVPWATNVYFIRRRESLPTATWSTDGGSLPDRTQSGHNKVSKTVKYLYSTGEVTGPMQKAAGSLYNALADEVGAHSQAMVEQLSTDIATATGSSDDISGIIDQIDNADTMNWGSSGTGVVDASSAYLTLNMIDEAIDTARGDVDLIITSRRVRRKINALLQAQQQFVDRTEVAAGFRVLTYDGLPIVTDLHWETDADILFIKRQDAKLLVHQDLTFEELAKTKDSTDFMIKGYFGFALEGRPVHLTNFTL